MRPGGSPGFLFRQSQDRTGKLWRARHILKKRTQLMFAQQRFRSREARNTRRSVVSYCSLQCAAPGSGLDRTLFAKTNRSHATEKTKRAKAAHRGERDANFVKTKPTQIARLREFLKLLRRRELLRAFGLECERASRGHRKTTIAELRRCPLTSGDSASH